MSTNLTTQREAVAFGTTGIELKSLDQAYRFAQFVKESNLAPNAYKDAGAILVVMQMGMELGYLPMQAIRNLWVGPDGKPNEYIEAAWARVLASGLVDDWSEEVTDKEATFRVTRKGMKTPVVSTFSIEQAMRAGIVKDGSNWKKYPERMLKARARGYALKDAFPDVLRGMSIAEVTDEFFRGADRARDITPPKRPDPLLEKLGLATGSDPADGSSQQDQDAGRDAPLPPPGAPAGESFDIAADGDADGAPGPGSADPSAALPFWNRGAGGKSGHFRYGLMRDGEVRYFSSVADWCAALCEIADTSEDYMSVWDGNVNVHTALIREFRDEMSQGHLQAAADHFRAIKKSEESDRRART